MKLSMSAILVSMMALLPLVNASAEDLPTGNHPSKKAGVKDAVKQPTSDFARLFEMLMKTGEDDHLKVHLSQLVGLTGTPPVKGRDFTLPRGKGKEYRECSIVFVDDSGNGRSLGAKRPLCVYIDRQIVSGHDSESYWYRMNLEGKLEKVTLLSSKYDDEGKPIPESGVIIEKDIDTPEMQKAFKAELAYWTKDWLKKEQKIIARAKTATASNAVDKEATAAAAPAATAQ